MTARRATSRRFRAILIRAVAVSGILLAAVGVSGPTPTSEAQTAALFTVTATPDHGLTDGTPVTAHIKAADGVEFVSVNGRPGDLNDRSTARICNGDSSPTRSDIVSGGTGGCLDQGEKVSSSQLPDNSSFFPVVSADAQQAETEFVVGTGSSPGLSGNPVVTCDKTHDCKLGVAMYLSVNGGNAQWVVESTTLAFEPPAPFGGCGKGDPSAISSVGTDRLIDAWTAWTRDYCTSSTNAGAPSTSTLSDEGPNLASYERGEADLAYAASTDDTVMDAKATRPSIAVPIALDAAVMGVGGWGNTDPEWPGAHRPYLGVKLTPQESAASLAWGMANLKFPSTDAQAQISQSILDDNPMLPFLWNQFDGLVPVDKAYTDAGLSAATLFSTRFFTKRAAEQWTVPFGADAGKARGIFASFGTAKPDFNLLTNGMNSQADLIAKASQFRIAPTTPTPAWFWTSLAAAKAGDLAPASLKTGTGEYVAPTTASLQAAVATMKPNTATGMLEPNPDPSADKTGAYPLTFVEYAIVPSAPLVTADCKPRTASQAVMKAWLTYVTTDGQSKVPDGLAPLTPDLKKQAADAIAKVGKGKSTCAPNGGTNKPPGTTTTPPRGSTTPPVTSPGNGATSGLGNDLGSGSDGLGAGGEGGGGLGSTDLTSAGTGTDGANRSGASASNARASTEASRKQANKAAQKTDLSLPSFFGAAPISALVPPLSLAGLVALTSFAAMGTSGRPMPALSSLRGRLLRSRTGGAGPTPDKRSLLSRLRLGRPVKAGGDVA